MPGKPDGQNVARDMSQFVTTSRPKNLGWSPVANKKLRCRLSGVILPVFGLSRLPHLGQDLYP